MTQTLPDAVVTASTTAAHARQRYPAYRDSGVSWLGAIPEHWEVKRLKYMCRMRYGESLAAEDRVPGNVAVFGSNGIVGTHERHNSVGPCLIIGRKGSYGKVAYCFDDCFVIDTAYAIDRYETRSNIRWLFYALGCLNLDQTSQDTGVPGLSREEAYSLILPAPPLDEQRAIAAYLDRETARLDALVAAKQRLIGLLREKRAALISHAVTRGLDAGVALKASGVPWLGKIPAHWQATRLKFAITSIEQGWSPECENRQTAGDEWGVLKVGCVNGISFDESEHKALPAGLQPRPELEIRPGDVLMSRANTRELLGSASVVGEVRPRLLLCDKLYRLHVKRDTTDPEFLVAALSSSSSRDQFEREATGASSSMQNIAQSTVREVWLAVPPLSQQRAILAQVRQRNAQIDTLMQRIERQIERLKEYRAALMAAAVTGKIDVR